MNKSTIFATHEKDSESGLYYARNRMYDSASGRFTSVDPIQDGLNWFLYCNGDPINRVDPTGLAAGQMHYDLTYGMALFLGFSSEEAHIIAQANLDMDYMDENHKVTKDSLKGAISNPDEHFNTNYYTDPTSSQTPKDSRYINALVYFKTALYYLKYGTRQQALRYIGYGLHCIQDMYTHLDKYVIYRLLGIIKIPGHAFTKTENGETNKGMDADNKFANEWGHLKMYKITISIINDFLGYLETLEKDKNKDMKKDIDKCLDNIKEEIDSVSSDYSDVEPKFDVTQETKTTTSNGDWDIKYHVDGTSETIHTYTETRTTNVTVDGQVVSTKIETTTIRESLSGREVTGYEIEVRSRGKKELAGQPI